VDDHSIGSANGRSDIDPPCPAAERDQLGLCCICRLLELFISALDPGGCVWRSAEHFDLCDRQRRVGLGLEATNGSDDPRGVGNSRDHGGFLNRQRHEQVDTVDHHVGGDPQRHAEDPDRVFDHQLGLVFAEARARKGLLSPADPVRGDPPPLGDLHPVEPRHPRASLGLHGKNSTRPKGDPQADRKPTPCRPETSQAKWVESNRRSS